ncbi:replicative DNA helicase [Marihabitans asiaticum]|nr:replicative DNA helicase [Marihabitans asiaticum]
MPPADEGEGGGRPGDRVPPQDLGAEQSVLGGMLLSKDAIADVGETVRGGDFYKPAHELIFDAIIDLYSKGEPADAITVADELSKRGTLQRAGGQAYLHDLIQSVPTAANAGFYAQIVAERAILRRLVDAGTRIVQMGYGTGGGDVEEIVNAAQAEMYGVAEKRGGEDYVALWDTLNETMAEIEVASGRSDELTGVPTGFTELDELTHGLHPGQMIVVAARPAVGKALALETPLPTPTGWTTMGEVAVGDQLLDATGRPTRVVAATEVMNGRPCYEVEFSDGTVIVADEQHQWLTDTRASRRSFQSARDKRNRCQNQQTFAEVRTTSEIAATLRTQTAERRLNHSVKLARPLDLPEADLPLSPYVLGAWLGDGSTDCAAITTTDDGIVQRLESEGLVVTKTAAPMRYSLRLPVTEAATRTCVVCGEHFVPRTSQVKTCGRSCGGRSRGTDRMPAPRCPDCGQPSSGQRRCQACHAEHGTVQGLLRTVGVLGNKHIPMVYLRASEAQRREVLAGLLDTDGTVTKAGCVQLTTTSRRLRDDAYDLVAGLGYRCGVSEKAVHGRSVQSSTAYTLTFSADEEAFALERKATLHRERRGRTFQRRDSRFITDVRAVPSVPVRCVEVDNDDHLYLAGRAMVPTHNSTLGIDVARAAAIQHKMATAVFSLEMSRTEITMRVLAAEASISLQSLRRGRMSDPEWGKLSRVMGRISASPLFIDDSPNLALMEIRAKARRLKQQHNLKLIVIDYLQLMTSGKKVESRQQEVAEFSRALKLLAKELEVPVIAISQLNRGPEQRTDKRPAMSDLRESGSIEQDADVVILLHRDRDPEAGREGEADVIVAKHRNGPTADITLGFQGHYARFTNFQREGGDF